MECLEIIFSFNLQKETNRNKNYKVNIYILLILYI